MDFFPFFNIKNILSLYSIHTWIDLRKQRDSFKKCNASQQSLIYLAHLMQLQPALGRK